MNLRELSARLYAARRAGVKLDLSRMHRLLDALGRPDAAAPAVLIGGTNGKGSTVAFASALLAARGRRVGAFTSPHLSRLAERFAVDGAAATDDAVVAAGARVEDAIGRVAGDEPTFFERVTAMALVLFADAAVDVALLEVGLGGRFDATNAVDAAVAAVTGVAMDHRDYLGDTLAAISREKAGIFAAGRPAIIGRSGLAEAVAMLEAHARDAGASPIVTLAAADVDALAGVTLGLAGDHQRANAACAVAITRALGHAGDPAGEGRALASARLAGRLEQLRPGLRADGAHNPHAAAALARAVDGPVVLVVGVSVGKDLAGIAAALAPVAGAVVATRSRNPRAVPAAAVADGFRAAAPGIPVHVSPTVAEALEVAGQLGPEVVLCGSLFAVAEGREACGLATPDVTELSDPV